MPVGTLARVVLLTSALTGSAAAQVPQRTARTDTAAALKTDMRKLWTDHVVWTRDYIIAAVDNKPDAPAALNRLMQNQDGIGSAVGKYYGAANGQKLTSLLKEHIAQAGDVVKAAKAGDKPALKQASDKWDQNAVAIADFLSTANPNWPRATLVDMMRKHLSTTTNEVQMRLNKDWDGDVRAFDAVYDHILMMSDALADGIVKQFPDKFATPAFN
jgi:hypothetical protein